VQIRLKQVVDVNNPEQPHGSVNCRCTTLSSRADALPRNLIPGPHAGFTTAKAQRSRSPVSSCTSKSRAGKLGAAQHHRVIKERKRRMERSIFSCVIILGFLSAFYRRDPLVGAIDLANKIHLWPLINLSSIEQRLVVRPTSVMVRPPSEPAE
jgi:hypothetical protein